MSDPSELEDPPQLVCVLDTSTLINIKTMVKVDDQWEVLTAMTELVKQGRLVFPTQVHKEMKNAQHPDAPGAWCGGAKRHVAVTQPTDETMAEIFKVESVRQLVDANSDVDHEEADPYVAAMAWELSQQSDPPLDVVVATSDSVDRLPRKSALTTACNDLGIRFWDSETFIAWVWDFIESAAETAPDEPSEGD
ncbi:DUF4411 family protein [Aeromicrobium sp.]|uniref:DUF4411 family protein n=1 Tax=Aeromicrobium sp. TaxID=1871063 RepID=UPI002FC944EF